MPSSAPRQSRLDVGDPDDALVERWANYRVLRKAFVSASALASFHHCAVKPFLERVIDAAGVATQTWAMRAGLRAHEEVQAALSAAAPPTALTFREALERRLFLFAAEYPLKDERRMLRGIADLLSVDDGVAHVIELKNARPPPAPDPTWGVAVHPEHAMQVEFYGLLARRELGVAPRLSVVYLAGGSREAFLQELAASQDPRAALAGLVARNPTWGPTKDMDALVNDALRTMRRMERRLVLPTPNHTDAGKCARCSVRAWCPRRLDRPGEFQHLAASLLDAR